MTQHADAVVFQRLLEEGFIVQMGWPWPYQVDVSKLNHHLFALASEVEAARHSDGVEEGRTDG